MVDASQTAFAAGGYFRILVNGAIEVVFVTGKTRVAPTELILVPRLELQAAVLVTASSRDMICRLLKQPFGVIRGLFSIG